MERIIRTGFIFIIKSYRYFISTLCGNCCRFEPSCSQYAINALEKYSCFFASYLILKRILRCQPFCVGGFDPLPEKNSNGKIYHAQ